MERQANAERETNAAISRLQNEISVHQSAREFHDGNNNELNRQVENENDDPQRESEVKIALKM